MDEPTSGLGATAAALVMKAVRRSTDALGLITLVTIHQPSRKMFEGFDNLLLLAKGGRACYCAEIGQKSQTLLKYFANLSGETSTDININPADFVLNVLDNGSPDDAVASFQQSTLSKDIYSAIDADINGAEGKTPLRIEGHKNSFFSELVLLVKRQFLVQWRNPAYSLMRVTVSASACFLLGLLFFNVKKDIQGAVFAIAAIFFMVFVLVIPMQSVSELSLKKKLCPPEFHWIITHFHSFDTYRLSFRSLKIVLSYIVRLFLEHTLDSVMDLGN